MRLGTRQPPKVFVRFVDDEYEGREEWCSVRALKALWPELAAFLSLEQKWVDVRRASPPEHDPRVEAASLVLSEVDGPIRGGWGRGAGLLRLYLDEPLASGWELDLQWLLDRDGFVDDDEAVAPWPALLEAAQYLAPRFAEPVLTYLEKIERENERGVMYGEHRESLYRDARPYYLPPEHFREQITEAAPVHALVREWCGVEAISQFDELERLRTELPRMTRFAVELGDLLRDVGETRRLGVIQRRHGLKIDGLRPPGVG